MKKEKTDKPEVKENDTQNASNDIRQPHEPAKKETMEERAKRENWTDVAESHLGIDE